MPQGSCISISQPYQTLLPSVSLYLWTAPLHLANCSLPFRTVLKCLFPARSSCCRTELPSAPSIPIHTSIHALIHLPTHPLTYPSIHPPSHLSTRPPTIHLPPRPPTLPLIHPSTHPSTSPYTHPLTYPSNRPTDLFCVPPMCQTVFKPLAFHCSRTVAHTMIMASPGILGILKSFILPTNTRSVPLLFPFSRRRKPELGHVNLLKITGGVVGKAPGQDLDQ